MKDYEDDLRPGIIFLFWIPLALTWIMMALEGPIVASVIARLEEAKLNLAAYGVALSVAFISEGPIIMLVSTATALVRDYSSYRKLLRFALLLNGLMTLLFAMVMIPQVFSFLADEVVGLPKDVGRLAYESTVFFLHADAIMGGGHFADTSTFAKQLYEKNVKAKMIALLVAPPEPKFAELGDACIGVVGSSQWEPLSKYSAEAAKAENVEWYGLSAADFTKDYMAKYNEEPSYHSAGGYVAGLLLEKAIKQSGSIETEKIKAILDAMDLYTFYGRIKFDKTSESHGLQVGHEMTYIQWQKGEKGPVKQVVWPDAAKTPAAILMPKR